MDARHQISPGKSQERYRLLADPIADYAIYMLDENGRVASWNARAQRFKGYEAREILGEHFSRFYTDEDRRAGLPEQALSAAAERGHFESEGWRVRKDGARFWAHVVVDPIVDANGSVVGYAQITRDLTERRRAVDALHQSEEQFRRLVQGVTDYAIFMLDPAGNVSSWNAGAQRIKGYSVNEILGRHFSTFYTEEDRRSGVPARALETAAREGRYEKEGWRVRKDGTRFFANVVIDAIRDDDGKLIGFAKVTRDITERKQAEQALAQAQRALFQTQKLESIGQLTGGIAHDFNNLLTAILGSLEVLRKRLRGDERSLALLDNAIQGAERGTTLTQRMLAFARRQELKLEAVDVPKLVAGMELLLERTLGPTVTIETAFADALPPVCSDPNQLESALLNLAVNARDAMPDGGVITIGAGKVTLGEGNAMGVDPGVYVCLSVTDTGEGMDEETLAHAAEPFFTTKGVGKGTGLGLPMVHGLAEQSGGRLRIASRRGQGTTVEIWLPATRAKVAATQQAGAGEEAPTPAQRRYVVLVVDDDPLVLVSTGAALDDLGYRVVEVESGARALEIVARDTSIDVVLTDQAMPGMTGIELADAIRQLRPGLPVILASGYAELPNSASPYLRRLSKPYRRAELANAITAAVGAPS
ncbi:MAG TPA: PAS domain S-box protein [Rudaea sp.]|nr:PAS domain S-box protein [Rudaea sp.]